MKLADIARAIDGRLVGDGDIEIARPVQPHQVESAADLPLVFSQKVLDLALDAPAVAAVVVAGLNVPDGALKGIIEIGDPRAVLVPLTALFARSGDGIDGIHSTAAVDNSATLGANVGIGPYVCVGADTEIGADTLIHSQATIGARVRMGSGCLIHSGVRIGDDVVVGDRVIIQPNACIGADGFSFATPEPPRTESMVRARSIEPFLTYIHRIHSLGTVVLGDDVEVGACSTIDRATIGATRVGRNTKIDNQVMIGHNTIIGEDCLLAGHVGISGSVTIGDRVIMAGKVGIVDHVTVGDDANLGARTTVMRDIPARAIMMGNPAMPSADYFNRLRHTHITRLGRAADKLRDLAARVARLEADRDGDD
jgi:UDP-3-O-[3-hydroxymyristoyl] glucosamine N-acyltransferase